MADRVERTLMGLRAAERRGVKLGRPLEEIPDPLAVLTLQARGLSPRKIARELNTTLWLVRQSLRAVAETPMRPRKVCGKRDL